MTRVAAVLAAQIVMSLLTLPAKGAPGASLPTTYAALKPSLALVAYKDGPTLITGSSFCVSSMNGLSYFLTNAHVVGSQRSVTMFLSSGKSSVGNVVLVNDDLDVAIIAVPIAGLRAVTFGTDLLPEGQAIAIAGYPSTHIDFALSGWGLTPSVHEGTVTSYPAGGGALEFDAQVEHGNSGGPVFDPETGLVYGIVELKVGSDQTNLAIPVSRVVSFIQSAQLSVTESTRGAAFTRVPPPPPGFILGTPPAQTAQRSQSSGSCSQKTELLNSAMARVADYYAQADTDQAGRDEQIVRQLLPKARKIDCLGHPAFADDEYLLQSWLDLQGAWLSYSESDDPYESASCPKYLKQEARVTLAAAWVMFDAIGSGAHPNIFEKVDSEIHRLAVKLSMQLPKPSDPASVSNAFVDKYAVNTLSQPEGCP